MNLVQILEEMLHEDVYDYKSKFNITKEDIRFYLNIFVEETIDRRMDFVEEANTIKIYDEFLAVKFNDKLMNDKNNLDNNYIVFTNELEEIDILYNSKIVDLIKRDKYSKSNKNQVIKEIQLLIEMIIERAYRKDITEQEIRIIVKELKQSWHTKSFDADLYNFSSIGIKYLHFLVKYNKIKPIYQIRITDNHKRGKTQVFFSHAFKDANLCYIIFAYFQKYNIFLFIDSMNYGPIENTVDLKDNLLAELKKSDQFLYFKTANSSIHECKKITRNMLSLNLIEKDRQVRQYCAWEFGVFYNIRNKEKFLLSKENINSEHFLQSTCHNWIISDPKERLIPNTVTKNKLSQRLNKSHLT